MTWLQQLLLTTSLTVSAGADASAAGCGDIVHTPEANVEHHADGVDLNPSVRIDAGQLDVPVVVDVLRRPGRPGRITGETLIGIATVDGATVDGATVEGRGAALQGPAVNEGQPVTLGAACGPLELGPLEPGAEPPARR